MAKKSIRLLSDEQRLLLKSIPSDFSEREIVRYYTLLPEESEIIATLRSPSNRLGFDMQTCALRLPGSTLNRLQGIPDAVTAHVALAGDFAVRALRELMEVMPYDCRYVFRSVRKGGKFNADDKPITGTDVYRMWRKSCVMASVDSTKPHDARRTFITEGLIVGVETHNIQKQVGHPRADTTLHYAQSLDAKNIRAKLRFRYGD